MNWVKNVAYSVGVVTVTKRSNSYLSGFVYKVVLMCDHGGKYKQKGSIRAPRTRKTDCPFELEVKYSDEYNYWTLAVICDEHNHRPLQSMEGHPYAQRLTQDEFSLVEELTAMNMPPRDILSIVREGNLSNVSTISTIYNARTKLRMAEQVGNSPMQVLMALLHSNNYVYEFSTTASNELENLFFVHQTSFTIWRAFPHVLIIDATYKTNYYNLTFVEIVGVTSTNKTFSIAFAFIQNERTANYTWVLNCLKLTLDCCMHPRVIVTDRELALSQHTAIKASFEKSRIVRYQKHNLRCFKLLHGFVSNEALNKILTNYHQVDPSNCDCRLRNSCGLPCSCELSKYINSGQCISLDSIDIFWRKLDFLPATSVEDDDVSCGSVLEHLKENYNKQSKVGRKSWLRKLKNIFSPSTTDIREPSSTIPDYVNSGYEPAKHSCFEFDLNEVPTDKCFEFDLIEVPADSCFEFDEGPPMSGSNLMDDILEVFHSSQPFFQDPFMSQSQHQNAYYPDSYVYTTETHNPHPYMYHNPDPYMYTPETQNPDPSMNDKDYLIDQGFEDFIPYITHVQNVLGDGNCGFRATAVCIGRHQDDWRQIRMDLLDELSVHNARYTAIFN
uniref:uncharacterized protein LOC122588797 n=1 Tax=Erigeron canadensis TaxID=72917 RepID=UPI001CB8EAEB|nr:uncharacterized protein LOC122588797 [Erigeron canadensis]